MKIQDITPPIRVLIADDHPVVRSGLCTIINHEQDMTVVALAEDGDEAVRLYKEHRPDVALIDLRMPRMDGLHVIEGIRQEFRSAHIVVLTTFDTDEDIYQALRAGAMAFLVKGAPPEELLGAIRSAHAGQKQVTGTVASRLLERMRSPELTSRELEVLKLLATGRSNKEIAAQLGVGEGTVRTHCNSIFPKLNVSDRTQAATVALRRGLVRLEDVAWQLDNR